MRTTTILFAALWFLLCPFHSFSQPSGENKVVPGDERMDEILPVLKGKRVALMANQTAMVGHTHLLDTLLSLGIHIEKVFAPEHGFRGDAGAGEEIKDSVDAKTGIPIISLYGAKKQPSAADLKNIDWVVFDIQDVGVRFFTFISSLHYLMQACAENKVHLLVLDRPNPNGWYVGGPVLEKKFSSFVGVDPVPIVYGLTEGEYAMMVNGEKWLTGGIKCPLKVIPCLNYSHSDKVVLDIPPSPNLPNEMAVSQYPFLGLLEGTNISVGRGTGVPFQILGAPKIKIATGAFEFTPRSRPEAKNPPHKDELCYGYDLRGFNELPHDGKFAFNYVQGMYKLYTDTADYFLKNNFFDKLAGTDTIRKIILNGGDLQALEAACALDLEAYKLIRKKYLLYKDFE